MLPDHFHSGVLGSAILCSLAVVSTEHSLFAAPVCLSEQDGTAFAFLIAFFPGWTMLGLWAAPSNCWAVQGIALYSPRSIDRN